jgi:hypothetical protein
MAQSDPGLQGESETVVEKVWKLHVLYQRQAPVSRRKKSYSSLSNTTLTEINQSLAQVNQVLK